MAKQSFQATVSIDLGLDDSPITDTYVDAINALEADTLVWDTIQKALGKKAFELVMDRIEVYVEDDGSLTE